MLILDKLASEKCWFYGI